MTAAERAAEKRLKPFSERVSSRRPDLGGITVEESMVPFWDAVKLLAEALAQAEQQRTTTEEALAGIIDGFFEDADAELVQSLARAILDAPDVPIRSTVDRNGIIGRLSPLLGVSGASQAADAILASGAVVEAGSPAVDREALIAWSATAHEGTHADKIDTLIVSGVVRDAAEVRADQIERDAQIAERHPQPIRAIWPVAIAAAIREQKP